MTALKLLDSEEYDFQLTLFEIQTFFSVVTGELDSSLEDQCFPGKNEMEQQVGIP